MKEKECPQREFPQRNLLQRGFPVSSRKRKKNTETAIMQQIRYALGVYGWFVFRVPPSLYGSKGLCDLIAVKNSVAAFIEVKAPNGVQSDDQKVFGSRIRNAGGIYMLARSIDDVEWLFTYGNDAHGDNAHGNNAAGNKERTHAGTCC
ncbi:MAG TPA: VRR-NUC domain-containing protein [Syntrophorhabdaceae bacterium]|nr:VRR-NUC domain-containing protein [Syntrophorhabdaceae bacterium]HQM82740.1 VRR-NUC domain-containing protein [Syntrophorhabdaceae bacterium]